MVKSHEQAPILKKILADAENCRKNGKRFLAVFDLDSTLFDLTVRISRIIDDFADNEEHRRNFPKECEALKSMTILPTDWGIDEGLGRIGLTGPSFEKFRKAIHHFWADGFFSDRYLHHDEPLPGSVEYVKALFESGAHIMYLTGRDIPRMLEGTKTSLRKRGFPIDEANIELILKPIPNADDAEFKLEALKKIENQFDQLWLFENEPVNINLIMRDCKKIQIVYIESTHSRKEQVPFSLEKITRF
jgi:hypothetical protein